MADTDQTQTPGAGGAQAPAAPAAPQAAPAADPKALRSEMRSVAREFISTALDEMRGHVNQVRNHLGLPAIREDGSVSKLGHNFHAYVEQVVRENGGNVHSDVDLEAATPEARKRWEEDYPPAPVEEEEGMSNQDLLVQMQQLMAEAQKRGLARKA